MNISRYSIMPLITLLIAMLLPGLTAEPAPAQSTLYDFSEFHVSIKEYSRNGNFSVSVFINLDGACKFEKFMKSGGVELDKSKPFTLTGKQLEYLYYRIMHSGFFDIGRVIGERTSEDGYIIVFSVRADSYTHTVTIYNERYMPIDELINVVLSMMPIDLAKEYRDRTFNFSEIKVE